MAHSDAIRISGWKNVDWPTRGKCGGKYTAGAARLFFVGLDLRREMRPSAPRVVEIAASKLDFDAVCDRIQDETSTSLWMALRILSRRQLKRQVAEGDVLRSYEVELSP